MLLFLLRMLSLFTDLTLRYCDDVVVDCGILYMEIIIIIMIFYYYRIFESDGCHSFWYQSRVPSRFCPGMAIFGDSVFIRF